MLQSIGKLYDGLITALAVLAGVATTLMFVLIVVDVSGRELLGNSFRFTVATVEYSMLYFTMLAAPWLMRTNGHVYIEAVIIRLPDGFRRSLEKLVYVLSAIACLIFGFVAAQLLAEAVASGELDIRSIDIPLWVIFAPLPICYGLVAVEMLRFLFGGGSLWSNLGKSQDAL